MTHDGGVYVFYLPFTVPLVVYVGESKHVRQRANASHPFPRWCQRMGWTTEVRCVVARRMPGATVRERRQVEGAIAAALEARGCHVVSDDVPQRKALRGHKAAKQGWAKPGYRERRAATLRARLHDDPSLHAHYSDGAKRRFADPVKLAAHTAAQRRRRAIEKAPPQPSLELESP